MVGNIIWEIGSLFERSSIHIFTRADLMDEMNVLVIMTNELRRDTLGFYGEKTNENG
tara:strand:- start:426 stop:596 length:171 start_codon:yes stop_codon:yes gene_type:complete